MSEAALPFRKSDHAVPGEIALYPPSLSVYQEPPAGETPLPQAIIVACFGGSLPLGLDWRLGLGISPRSH